MGGSGPGRGLSAAAASAGRQPMGGSGHASYDGTPSYAYKEYAYPERLRAQLDVDNPAAAAQARRFECMVGSHAQELHGTWRLVIHDVTRRGAVQVVATTEAGIARAWAEVRSP